MLRRESLIPLLLMSLAPALAQAGNADEILLGNDAAITAGAVVATINDGSALWYNPAGLALAVKDSVDVSASAFALRKYALRRLIAAGDGSTADGSFTEVVTVPSALTYVRTLSPRTVVGVGLFTSQRNNSVLRAWLPAGTESERTSLGFATAREVTRYHAAAGLGFRLAEAFTLGCSLFGDYDSESASKQAYAGVKRGGEATVFNTATSIDATNLIGVHARVGVHYTPFAALSLGLSIASPSLYFYRSSRATGVDSELDPSRAQVDFQPIHERTSGGTLGMAAPLRVRLGAALRFRQTTLALDGDLQTPIEDAALDLDQGLVWNLRLGARARLTDSIDVGAGLFTDRGFGRFLSGNRPQHFYGGTLGGEYQRVRQLAERTERNSLTFSTTVALRYAYGGGRVDGFRFPEGSGQSPYLANLTVHELTLHIGSGLYF